MSENRGIHPADHLAKRLYLSEVCAYSLANPALARRYLDALSVAFFQTYIANQPSYRPYLSAAYANAISQDPLKLSLVRSLTATEVYRRLI